MAALEAVRAHAQGDPILEGELGRTYGLAGRRDEARAVLEQLKQRRATRYLPAIVIAWVYTGLGENDYALAWLTKAVEERDAMCVYLRTDGHNPLRADPRFQALLRRMNFPETAAPIR